MKSISSNITERQQQVMNETLDWFLLNNPERITDLMNGNCKQLIIDASNAYALFAAEFDHNSKEMDAFIDMQAEKIYSKINHKEEGVFLAQKLIKQLNN